jgi:hypothetical protein
MHSRFTPTCFSKSLPSSGGRSYLRSYSSNLYCGCIWITIRPVWWVVEGCNQHRTLLVTSLHKKHRQPRSHCRYSHEAHYTRNGQSKQRYCNSKYIIIIRHELGLDRLLSVSSNSLFKGLRPIGLQFSIISGILLLLILVICRSQFYLSQRYNCSIIRRRNAAEKVTAPPMDYPTVGQ